MHHRCTASIITAISATKTAVMNKSISPANATVPGAVELTLCDDSPRALLESGKSDNNTRFQNLSDLHDTVLRIRL